MTIEKAVVAGWGRVAGWQTDGEARRLGLAFARKRARVVFSDGFVEFASPLMSRVSSKHDKQKRIPKGGRFVEVKAVAQTLEDLTARAYVESDPLDRDDLSTRDV